MERCSGWVGGEWMLHAGGTGNICRAPTFFRQNGLGARPILAKKLGVPVSFSPKRLGVPAPFSPKRLGVPPNFVKNARFLRGRFLAHGVKLKGESRITRLRSSAVFSEAGRKAG